MNIKNWNLYVSLTYFLLSLISVFFYINIANRNGVMELIESIGFSLFLIFFIFGALYFICFENEVEENNG